jgi:hypothetical protein
VIADEASTGADVRHERWNYSMVLSSSIASAAAGQLVNPSVVLPFLYMSLGAPIVFAGLLYPFMKGASLLSGMLIAPFLEKPTHAKLSVCLPTLLSAAALATIALWADSVPVPVAVVLFIAVAVVLGLCRGVSNVGFSQLLGTVIPSHRRVPIAFTQSLLAGIAAIIVVALTKDSLAATSQPMQMQVTVLWAGIAATLIAAIIVVTVRLVDKDTKEPPPPVEADEGPKGIYRKLRAGFKTGMSYHWFRRYLVARILFLSVTLAMPFYTIHAASVHKTTPHGLSILVIAASAGIVIGSIIWRWLAVRTQLYVMIASACIGAIAAALALFLEFTGGIANIALYAIAIVLVAVSANGIRNAIYLYFIDMTSESERPYLQGSADLIVGVLSISGAAVLGVLAQLAHPAFPLVAFLVLGLVAAYVATRLEDPANRAASRDAATAQ